MQDPQITIVVVLRERFSLTERSLASIYENTQIPFFLVYVAGKAPSRVQRYLQEESNKKGFLLITTAHHISPNQARNLGLKEVKTKYVVFLDNDAMVAPGWLEALIRCAEETGAWVVGPLCLIGEISAGVVHVAGGNVHFREQSGEKTLYDEQYLFNTPIRELKDRLVRRRWDYVEFHCMLVRTDVFQSLGTLDEQLLSVHEHIDFCLGVNQAGGLVYVEPKSVVTYIPSPPYQWTDLSYFMLRWSEEWNIATTNRFCQKWGVTAFGWSGNNQSTEVSRDLLIKFGRGQRRIMTGVTYAADEVNGVSAVEQAELMIALLQSIDRDCFDLRVNAKNGKILELIPSLSPEDILRRLPELLREAKCGVAIRPVDKGRQSGLSLFRLDGLDPQSMAQVKNGAFLVLETEPKTYQCWFAVDKRQLQRLPSLASKMASDNWAATQDHFAPLAGSRRVAPVESPLVRIAHGSAGLLLAASQSSNSSMELLLEQCIAQ